MPSEGDLRGLAEGVHLSGEIYWGGHMTPYSRARCPQNCRGGCDMHGIDSTCNENKKVHLSTTGHIKVCGSKNSYYSLVKDNLIFVGIVRFSYQPWLCIKCLVTFDLSSGQKTACRLQLALCAVSSW